MISIEETKKVAELAKLEFDEKGLEKMSKELSNILGYMEILNDIDTDNVIVNEIMSSNINCIREDKVEKFENTKGILENAKIIGDMINVPSINNNEEQEKMEKEEILKLSVRDLEKLVEDEKITKKEIYQIYLENIQKEDRKNRSILISK